MEIMNRLIKYVPTIIAGLVLADAIETKCVEDVLMMLAIVFVIVAAVNLIVVWCENV